MNTGLPPNAEKAIQLVSISTEIAAHASVTLAGIHTGRVFYPGFLLP
jgi:hypothetical protein